jgi:hypothetical protein
VGHQAENISLRRLLWRYEAITYQTFMHSSHVVAGVFNSRRRKQTDKWYRFTDFHPQHQKASRGASGVQVVSTMVGWYAGEMQWAEGYGPDSIRKVFEK